MQCWTSAVRNCSSGARPNRMSYKYHLRSVTATMDLLYSVISMSLQVKLLNRFLVLLRCHKKTDNYVAYVATLGNVVESLPIAQLQLPATIKQLTEVWVWLKVNMVPGTCVEMDINGRSFLHLLGRIPLDLQASYLEQELSQYLVFSRHPLHAAVVPVLRDLVSLQAQLGSSLLATHYSIQLAAVCLQCSPQCCHPLGAGPEALLDQALERLACEDHTPRWEVHQGLATAHLWKAVMVFQHNARYV